MNVTVWPELRFLVTECWHGGVGKQGLHKVPNTRVPIMMTHAFVKQTNKKIIMSIFRLAFCSALYQPRQKRDSSFFFAFRAIEKCAKWEFFLWCFPSGLWLTHTRTHTPFPWLITHSQVKQCDIKKPWYYFHFDTWKI